VIFVTSGKADLYRAHFPVLRDKRVLVSPNGWDPLIVSKASPNSERLAHFQARLYSPSRASDERNTNRAFLKGAG